MDWIFLAGFFLIGHMFTEYGKVAEVGRVHYWTHVTYALLEPLVIRMTDFMVSRKFITDNPLGRTILRLMSYSNILLPHGVVVPTGAAIQILRDIEKHSGEEAHIAVGTCVCQRNLDRYKEPSCKDMTIWYGAEIYDRFFGDEYRFISADEAVQMLKDFHRQGLAQVVEFLMQSRRWMFVICNCDAEICCPTRIYNVVRRSLYPGPFIAGQAPDKCLGKDECGACVSRCHFGANVVEDGKVSLDLEKCLGCGLCVTTCKGKARKIERRPGYKGRLLPWDYVKEAALKPDETENDRDHRHPQ